MQPSPSRERIAIDYSFLFKAIAGVRNGGCRVGIWLPTHRPQAELALPLAMMSHGGGWTIGALDTVPYNQIRYLLENGVAVASFEYRFFPHVTYKEIREDLLDAYRYVQNQINDDLEEAGSMAKIDSTRCSFMGWSAGGTNTIWIGHDTSEQVKNDSSFPPLRAIISSYPVANFSEWPISTAKVSDLPEEMKLIIENIKQGQCSASYSFEITAIVSWIDLIRTHPSEAMKKALKATPGSPEAIMPEMPSRLTLGGALIQTGTLTDMLKGEDALARWEEPINLISSDYPPTCIVAATEDKLIPVQQSHDLYARLQEHDVESMIAVCQGMEHGEAEAQPHVNWMESWWEEGIRPSLDFAIERMKA